MVLYAALVAGCIVTPTVGALAAAPVQPFVVAQATLGTEGVSAEATKDMFAAVYKNDLAAVKSSVLAGADIYSRNAWGMAALDIAIDSGYFDVAFYLLSVRNNRQAPDARAATSTTPVPVPQPVPQPAPQPVVTAAPRADSRNHAVVAADDTAGAGRGRPAAGGARAGAAAGRARTSRRSASA